MLEVSPIYAGLLAVLFFWLSLRVSLLRLKGLHATDEGRVILHRAVRTQGNASEYIPLGVLMLLILDLQGAPAAVIHIFGIALVAGRIGHFIGFGREPGNPKLRQYSMVATYVMLCFSGLAVLWFTLVG